MLMNTALKNCLMLARRESNRRDTDTRTLDAWKHIMRFCAEAGIKSDGILRAPGESIKHNLISALFEELAPKASHEGSCGLPDSGCDGACMERAHLIDTIRKAVDSAIDEVAK